MEHTYLLTPDLSLFDGAAPGGAAAGSAAAEGAVSPADTPASPGSSRRGKTGETARVVYGRQAGTSETVNGSDAGSRNRNGAPGGAQRSGSAGERTSNGASEPVPRETGEGYGVCEDEAPTPAERKAQFDALISQDYKDLFDERVQGILNRRFKEVKTLQAQNEAARPILDMLAQRYGLEEADPAKLTAALEADDAYWEEAAQEHGMTAPQYRAFMKLQRENERFRREAQRRQGEAAAAQQVAAWQREAEEARADYPGLDLAAECQSPQFLGMLKAGVPVRHAYEVLHLGEIKQSTAQRTERQVTETIRAKGARPSENGVAAASGIAVKSDPARLTRADRAEIARRVARGEQISF